MHGRVREILDLTLGNKNELLIASLGVGAVRSIYDICEEITQEIWRSTSDS